MKKSILKYTIFIVSWLPRFTKLLKFSKPPFPNVQVIFPPLLKYIIFIASYFCFIININAQCASENHSTNPQDSWLSCTTTNNPNASRGNSHWMLYDLGYIYNLTSTKFWNYNVTNSTDKGFKNIAIDYSTDGTTWTTATTFELAQATGTNSYSGVTGPDLGGLSARYVLLTALDTWGNNCAGLSEVKFDVDGSLGVLLKNFSVTCEDEKIQIYWQTSTEQDNDFFRIEKSEDGLVWQTLDKVYSRNNSPSLTNYEWAAKDIQTTSAYYRLTQTDWDGKTSVSPSIWVEDCSTAPNFNFTIYPNPVVTRLQLDYADLDVTDIVIRSASGHEVRRIIPQNFETFIDVFSLPSGIYFLTILTKNQGQFSQRFIKK